MMNKIWKGMIAGALVLTIGATTAFAAGGWHHAASRSWSGCQGSDCQYVDADGDGICDNRGTGCRYTDADGDGVCDYYGAGWGHRGGHHGW